MILRTARALLPAESNKAGMALRQCHEHEPSCPAACRVSDLSVALRVAADPGLPRYAGGDFRAFAARRRKTRQGRAGRGCLLGGARVGLCRARLGGIRRGPRALGTPGFARPDHGLGCFCRRTQAHGPHPNPGPRSRKPPLARFGTPGHRPAGTLSLRRCLRARLEPLRRTDARFGAGPRRLIQQRGPGRPLSCGLLLGSGPSSYRGTQGPSWGHPSPSHTPVWKLLRQHRPPVVRLRARR
jgi:hypothetical protein